MLSSDILEQQFGPTEVKILFQNSQDRIIQTVTLKNQQILETSWVTFNQKGTQAFPDIHTSILEGASIGKSFRTSNMAFERQTKEVARTKVPLPFTAWFNSSEPAWVIDVTILAGEPQIEYCKILEVYSPAIKWPQTTTPPSLDISKRLKTFAEKLTLLLS